MGVLNYFGVKKKSGRNLEWPKLGIPIFSCHFGVKKLEEIQNSQNGAFQIFSNYFGVKKLEEIQNSQNGAFQIFSNYFGIKIKWKKFGTVKIGCSELFPTILVFKDCKKFGTAKTGHSEFFQPFSCKKTRRNLEKHKFI